MYLHRGKIVSLCIVFCLFLGMGVSKSFSQTTLKLGSLDLDLVQQKWEKWKTAEETIRNLIASKRKGLIEKRNQLMDSYESYKLQKELIPQDAAKERFDKLQLENNNLQQKELDDAKEVDAKKAELIDPLMESLKMTVEQIAKEEKFSFIFARRLLFYADPSMDITDKVIERLNK